MVRPLKHIVVKFHDNNHTGVSLQSVDAYDIAVIAAKDAHRPVDLVLWAPTSNDGPTLDAIIRQHHPVPVFVVLDATRRPSDTARYLRAGAIQCLIDPPAPVLVAHIRATVRGLRTNDPRPDRAT